MDTIRYYVVNGNLFIFKNNEFKQVKEVLWGNIRDWFIIPEDGYFNGNILDKDDIVITLYNDSHIVVTKDNSIYDTLINTIKERSKKTNCEETACTPDSAPCKSNE